MEGRTRFRGAAYLVPVAAVALALPLTWWITPLEQTPSTLFLAAVMLSAYCGGLGPGLLATVLSGLALDWFFMPPAYSLQTGIADAVRLGVFVLVAVMISSLSGGAAAAGTPAQGPLPGRAGP